MSARGSLHRVAALGGFLLARLLGSWGILIPLGGGAAFYSLAFKYAMGGDQFRLVMGTWLGVLGVVGALLLAGRADRPSSYTLVARLPRRAELLAAIVVGAWCLALGVGGGLTLLAVLQNRVSPADLLALSTLGTCALLPLAGAVAGLHLTRLVSRGGSQLIAYLLLIGILVVADQRWLIEAGRFRRLVVVYDRLVWPLGTLLKGVGRDVSILRYLLAAAIVVGGSALLLALAVTLLGRKDLIWVE